MALHRAEQVIAAFVTAVTGLTTSGANVARGRDTPWPLETTDALNVYMGPEALIEDESDFPDGYWVQTIFIDVKTRQASVQVDTQLNLMRAEITAAIMADHTLGLAFVQWSQEGDTDEPTIDKSGEQPMASVRTSWLVKYRRNWSDTTA